VKVQKAILDDHEHFQFFNFLAVLG